MTPVRLVDQWRDAVALELEGAVSLRHRLHSDPRVSGEEGPTAELVAAAIGAGQGSVVADTGRAIEIGGGGRTTVALRAELDALPIAERSSVPWRSATDVMHACGHDIHLAALVAVTRAARTLDLPARLVALLQPREEGTYSGAKDIAAAGVADDWSAVVAAHVQPQLASAVTAVTPGAVNASTTEFTITVSGRGGHSGYPHTVDDSVLAMSATVVALQHIGAGTIDPVKGVAMMVTQIDGGSAANIVPDTVQARGTVRAMSEPDERAAEQAMERIVHSTAAAYGCRGEVEFHPGEPALVNDPAIARSTRAFLTGMGRSVDSEWRSFGSDDFSHFAGRTRTLMLFVGTGSDNGGLHDNTYVPSDDYILLVADALIAGYCGAATAFESD